nr:hypothetical protein [uncultured Brevundimonas sp.]
MPLVVFAGKEYGTGSSRDWAAKGACVHPGVERLLGECVSGPDCGGGIRALSDASGTESLFSRSENSAMASHMLAICTHASCIMGEGSSKERTSHSAARVSNRFLSMPACPRNETDAGLARTGCSIECVPL